MIRTPLTAIVLAAVVLTGCGGPSEAEQAKAAASKKAAAKKRADEQARAAAKATHDKCEQALAGITDALEQINSRLSVGMNYSEYGDRLGDVQVEYDRIDIKALPSIDAKCLDAAVRLENAFNLFNEVHTLWGDCIEDYDCDFSEGEPNRKAQEKWRRAGQTIENAKGVVDSLAPESGA